MPAIQFPQYTYLAGASPLAPKGHGNPRAEQMLRQAVLLGFTVAEHCELRAGYSADFTTPQSDDALRLDAVLARAVGKDEALMVVARRAVNTAIHLGGWDNYMRLQTAGQTPGGRTYRTATPAPDLMAVATACKLVENMQITPPRAEVAGVVTKAANLPAPQKVTMPSRAVPAHQGEPKQFAFDFAA